MASAAAISFHLTVTHPTTRTSTKITTTTKKTLLSLNNYRNATSLPKLDCRCALSSDKPSSAAAEPAAEDNTTTEGEDKKNFDKRRLEEKFAVLNTGIYECRSCGYLYNEAAGDPSYPIPPGFGFGKLPDDWRCPTCGAAKSFFQSKSIEIAGFAQNQQFGLGGNTLTAGQKALLIYGGLLLGFMLFLSGYFLQ